jgi:hypothetical protein
MDSTCLTGSLTKDSASLSLNDLVQRYDMTERIEGDLVILRSKSDAVEVPYLKGLIYRKSTQAVVCPGIITAVLVTAPPLEGVFQVYPAYDGVLFRVYWADERWQASTTGQINPTHGWGGPAFATLFRDVPIDYDRLNRDYCYYVLMEHQGYTNIIQHGATRGVLTEIVTLAQPFQSLPLSPENTAGFEHIMAPIREGEGEGGTGGPVGCVFHMVDGTRLRWETGNFQAAREIKPNLPDVYAHWVHLLNRPKSDWQHMSFPELFSHAEAKMQEYCFYFPWNLDKFIYMRCRFMEVHMAICAKIADRRATIPSRLMKFTRELLPEEKTAEGVLGKLLASEEKHLYYLMNPNNIIEDRRSENPGKLSVIKE